MVKMCHETQLVKYLGAPQRIRKAEEKFLKEWKGVKCCETISQCPLRS